MHSVVMAFDAGSSLTKAVYWQPGMQAPKLILMEPKVVKVETKSIKMDKASKSSLLEPEPEDDAWLVMGDECYVVGSLASEYMALSGLELLKAERTVQKVLAAVGAMAQKMKMKGRITLALTVLLPYGEYANREMLVAKLTSALQEFKFRDDWLKVKATVQCRHEGEGLALIRLKQQGKDWLLGRNIGILMMGHRNTSILSLDRSRLSDDGTNQKSTNPRRSEF